MGNKVSVLQTIRYSDLFDFPVTEAEIWQYLISTKPISKKQLHDILKKMQGKEIGFRSPYYYLPGREKIVALRKSRQIASREKLEQVKTLLSWFSFIPTLRYAGISGSLARMNADKHDDIDLFIITEAKTVWVTRLLLLTLLQFLGKRRKRGEQHAQDKICLNFLLDTRYVAFSQNRHDVYTAYEIGQLKTLYDRNNTYSQFLRANRWIKKYLPHFSYEKMTPQDTKSFMSKVLCFVCFAFEPLARLFQLWIIQQTQTSEIVTDGIAAFHPHDYRPFILKSFAHSASKSSSGASKKGSLWGIDKAKPIIYTRKDYTVSPNTPLERLSFKRL